MRGTIKIIRGGYLKVLFALLQAMLVIIAVGIALAYWKYVPPKPPALQAFINANVLTVNANNDKAEAVLLEADRIIAVGSTKEITSLIKGHYARARVRVHDLVGKTLMPGIIDAHSHFPGSGVYRVAADLNAPPIGNVQNVDQMLDVLRQLDAEKSRRNNHDQWLFGLGYDNTQMTEARHPLRQELDAVSTQRPIFILHSSGHMGVANTAALRELGIDASSVAPDGGAYVKNEQGQLTGLILETAVSPFLQEATSFSLREQLRIVKTAARDYAAQGVTSAQNGGADKRHVEGLYWASKLGVVPQRLVVWPLHKALSDEELRGLRGKKSHKFEVGAIKLVADGSIQGYTAYLTQPYHQPPQTAAIQPHSAFGKDVYGAPVIDREFLSILVKSYLQRGQQLAIHGNGDASIDDILFAIEQALLAFPRTDPRTVLVHAQMARKDQLRKMRELGITPSFFSAHTYYWGDRHQSIFIGPERAAGISPAKSAQRTGLRFSIHLDTPVVPMQPMRLLWSAVNRRSFDGRVIGRRERISREQAIRAITIDAAYQVFKETQIGSIEVGKLADLVVLDQDPSHADTDLLSIKVQNTYVGGVEIYSR